MTCWHLAAPIYHLRGDLAGAIAIAWPSDRMPSDAESTEALGQKIVDAPNNISDRLGWLGNPGAGTDPLVSATAL